MASSTDKVRENRLRRAAERQGLILVKSRRRDPRALDYGLYVLIEDTTGNRMPNAQAAVSAFARGEGEALDGIERQLLGHKPVSVTSETDSGPR